MSREMREICIICGSTKEDVDKLFCFPHNPEKLRLWNESLGIVLDHEFSSRSKICSQHFPKNSFMLNKTPLTLKRDALPLQISMKDCSSPRTFVPTNNVVNNVDNKNKSILSVNKVEKIPLSKITPSEVTGTSIRSGNAPTRNTTEGVESNTDSQKQFLRFEPVKEPSGALHRKMVIKAAKVRGGPFRLQKVKQNSQQSSISVEQQRKIQHGHASQPVTESSSSYGYYKCSCMDISSPPTSDCNKSVMDVDDQSTKVIPSTSTGETSNSATGSLKMAVVLKYYPDEELTDVQGKSIQHSILGKVWECEPGAGPKFTNSYFDKGVVYITCADETSKKWLQDTVKNIQPWHGAVLRIGTVGEIIKVTKMAVWIPKTDLIDLTDHRGLFQLFQTQNSGLEVNNWKVISKRVEEKGTSLILYVDDVSLKALESVGYKAFLGFQQLTFRSLGHKS